MLRMARVNRQEMAVLETDGQRIEHLGLTLTEAKHLLTQLQQLLWTYQVAAFLETRSRCGTRGAALEIKRQHTRTLQADSPQRLSSGDSTSA